MGNKKTKIMIIINDLLLGGAQRIVLDLVRGIDHNHYEVVVVSLKSVIAFEDKNAPSLIDQIKTTPSRVVIISDKTHAVFSEFVGLVSLIRTEKPSIVHTFLPYAGILGRLAARIGGVRHIISTQCNVPVAYTFKVYWLDRLTLSLARVWTAASEAIEIQYGKSIVYMGDEKWKKGSRHCTIVAGVDCERIERSISTIDRETKRKEIGIGPNDFMILMTARLVPWKGHEDLVRALSLLPQYTHVCFVGWGHILQNSLEQLAQDLHVSMRIHFLGARTDTYELSAVADVFVQPFSKDAKGNMWMGPNTSQMEACAVGVPSISTRVPLMEALIENGVTGTLANVNDPKSLAEAIQWVMEHPNEAKVLATHARERVRERYSLEGMIRNYELLYREMLAS